jgi:hypothetical protein
MLISQLPSLNSLPKLVSSARTTVTSSCLLMTSRSTSLNLVGPLVQKACTTLTSCIWKNQQQPKLVKPVPLAIVDPHAHLLSSKLLQMLHKPSMSSLLSITRDSTSRPHAQTLLKAQKAQSSTCIPPCPDKPVSGITVIPLTTHTTCPLARPLQSRWRWT